jgi:hypothetical protein
MFITRQDSRLDRPRWSFADLQQRSMTVQGPKRCRQYMIWRKGEGLGCFRIIHASTWRTLVFGSHSQDSRTAAHKALTFFANQHCGMARVMHRIVVSLFAKFLTKCDSMN